MGPQSPPPAHADSPGITAAAPRTASRGAAEPSPASNLRRRDDDPPRSARRQLARRPPPRARPHLPARSPEASEEHEEGHRPGPDSARVDADRVRGVPRRRLLAGHRLPRVNYLVLLAVSILSFGWRRRHVLPWRGSKADIFAPHRRHWCRRFVILGLFVGLPLSVLVAAAAMIFSQFFAIVIITRPRHGLRHHHPPRLSRAHGARGLSGPHPRITGIPLAATGRMALTNTCSRRSPPPRLSYHWGFGLFGSLSPTEQLLVVIVIYLAPGRLQRPVAQLLPLRADGVGLAVADLPRPSRCALTPPAPPRPPPPPPISSGNLRPGRGLTPRPRPPRRS